MLPVLFALIIVILFHASLAMAASGNSSGTQPVTPPASSPEAQPEACRECGLPYYRPSDAPSETASDDQPEVTSDASTSIEAEAESGRSHLSSDPRVNTARVLVERQRFAEALQILRPLVPDHPNPIEVRFLLGLAASRGSQTSGVEEETRLALLDEAIAAFRSILIHRPELVRVRLELALAFYLKEEDQLARDHFDRALVGRPPAALVANINRFLNVMRERRRWRGYFGFSIAPDTNINAASDAQFIYINGLPVPPWWANRRQFRDRRGGLGRRRIPVSSGRALAPAHGD